MPVIRVYHRMYGCETGCCGHVIEVDGDENFHFDHPMTDQDYRAYAEELVRSEIGDEHVKDLDWENSSVSDD